MDSKMGPSNQFTVLVVFPGVQDEEDDNRNGDFYNMQDSDQESTDSDVQEEGGQGGGDLHQGGDDIILDDDIGLQEIREERFPSSQFHQYFVSIETEEGPDAAGLDLPDADALGVVGYPGQTTNAGRVGDNASGTCNVPIPNFFQLPSLPPDPIDATSSSP
jgi:hypothetical protein